MTRIVFLLPPSEGKNKDGNTGSESLSFKFEKPKIIATHATQKDLKSKGKRYEEGLELNNKLIRNESDNHIPAIERYSGVMYNAIGYKALSNGGQNFFDKNFLILSGMHGLLHPNDYVGNYKLPIESKGLVSFWGDSITQEIKAINPEYVVNLLPLSYQKMIDFKILHSVIINVNFYTKIDGNIKKVTHGVKKIKGEWIRNVCENEIENYKEFGGEYEMEGRVVNISIFS